MGGIGSGGWNAGTGRPLVESCGSISVSRGDFVEDQLDSPSVELTWTPCNFGGMRPWYLCPQCGRRCGYLYRSESEYVCRICLGLGHRSQRESAFDRLMRRVLKARLRVGGLTSILDLFPPQAAADALADVQTGC